MEIAVSRHGEGGEIAVVRVSGVVDSETVEAFGETLERVMEEGCYNLVLDIEGLTYINTAGLSIIADAFKKCSQNRGSLKILRAAEPIRELLDVVRFTKIIDMFEDEGEALASFK
ncbi:STAS domain-containing protein [Candidatus Solincola tengchongensis]|uniref:STAS domain-containing protein n=1 Tax=Candidatus Solincola tengchongensis TaxID=2900693 RepID=UPI00257CEFCB|nr:STAS domain-containing protein [Candidatus Solincola tengchongensis]